MLMRPRLNLASVSNRCKAKKEIKTKRNEKKYVFIISVT